jgi:hypothetical protein
MGWCSLRFTPEVRAWLAALGDDDFGWVAFYLDLLRQRQGLLPEPHSRRLHERRTAGDRYETLGADRMWTKCGPGRAAELSDRALRGRGGAAKFRRG